MKVTVLAALLAFASATATAQIRECPGISIEGYKVMLDGLSWPGAGNQNSAQLLNRLRQKVRLDLAAIQLETTPTTTLVPCNDRAPQDVSDFNSTVLDSLNGHRVLVEIWGQIEARGGLTLQKAQLNYTLVPVSFYDLPVVPQGGFGANYQQRLQGTPDELVKMFGEFSDLKTYVSVAAGVKSLKEHDYDQAYLCFCRASSLLKSAPLGMTAPVRQSLASYLNQKVADTVSQARTDRSVQSSLGLEGTRPSCPGALQ